MNTPLPNDYFWVKQGNGVRYYLKSTGKLVAKSKIPKEILELIPEKDKYLQAVDLIEKLKKVDEKIYKQKMAIDTWVNFEDPQLVLARETLVKIQARRARLLIDYSNFSEEIRQKVVYIPVSSLNLPKAEKIPEPKMPKVSPTPDAPHASKDPGYRKQRYQRGSSSPQQPRQYKQRNFQPHRQNSAQTSSDPFEQFFGKSSGRPSGRPSGQSSNQSSNQSKYQPSTKNDFDRLFEKYQQEFHNMKSGPQSGPKKPTPPPNQSKPAPPLSQREKDEQFLKRFGIGNRQDWKTWLKQHHPDKDPNTDLNDVQNVNAAAKRVFD